MRHVSTLLIELGHQSYNGEINTLSRNFFNWSRNSTAFLNSRFFAACSMAFPSRVIVYLL